MKEFAGKITFITGGASGAGLGQAKLFGGLGAKITIVDIRREAIEKAVAELKSLGIDALGIQMDLTNREQYIAADKAEKHWGGPRSCSSNCRRQHVRACRASTFEDYDWVLESTSTASSTAWSSSSPYDQAYGVAAPCETAVISPSYAPWASTATLPTRRTPAAAVNNFAFGCQRSQPYGIGVTVQCRNII